MTIEPAENGTGAEIQRAETGRSSFGKALEMRVTLAPDLEKRLKENARRAYQEAIQALSIRERITVGEWAAKYRRIGQGGSPLSMHGAIEYDVDVMPWCAEPMEAAIDPTVTHLCLWFASGMGKTDGIVSNVIGYCVTESPRNIMALYPTDSARDKWSRDVLKRTIDATPILRRAMADKESRETGHSISYKAFPGGSIYATAAGSPSNLRGPRIGLAYAGEIDAMPVSVGKEGDPLNLLWRRCEGFEDAIKILEGTGTVKGKSRIEAAFNISDQRKWFIPCRKCGERFVLMFSHLDWPKGKPEKAVVLCPKCAVAHSDEQRMRIVRAGQWKATAPFSGVRGYWINGLNTTLPAEKGYRNKLHQISKEWLDIPKSANPRESLTVFVQTTLAQTIDPAPEAEARMDWEQLYERREDYIKPKQPIVLPEPVRVITGGIDLQANRVEIGIEGWARDEQWYGLEYIVEYGDPTNSETWDRVEKHLHRLYPHPSGAQVGVSLVFADRGKWPDAADKFALRPSLMGRIYTCKGASESGLPIIGKIRKTGRGQTYFRIGTDAAKDYIAGKLKIIKPENRETFPAGYQHFPETFPPEYFQQLTAERVTTKYERGQEVRKWLKENDSDRNEALDIRVYSLAAFRLRRWDWEGLEKSFANAKEKKPAAPKPEEEEEPGGFVGNWRR